ncbi:hypothetical protein D3C71_2051530 [compost metagenome]
MQLLHIRFILPLQHNRPALRIADMDPAPVSFSQAGEETGNNFFVNHNNHYGR